MAYRSRGLISPSTTDTETALRSGAVLVATRRGLANRLRLVLACLHVLEQLHCDPDRVRLEVYWPVDRSCPGSFLDLFEPLERVRFHATRRQFSEARRRLPQFPFRPRTFAQICDDASVAWDYKAELGLYRRLRLIRPLRRRLASLAERLQIARCIGIHLRRTDHARLARRRARFAPDSHYERAITRHLNADPHQRFFLATDNGRTQRSFLRRFPDNVVVAGRIGRDRGLKLRKTGLDQAALDVHLLSMCRGLYPSGYSSFSNLAKLLHDGRVGPSEWMLDLEPEEA